MINDLKNILPLIKGSFDKTISGLPFVSFQTLLISKLNNKTLYSETFEFYVKICFFSFHNI
jgi:hypothetical protein